MHHVSQSSHPHATLDGAGRALGGGLSNHIRSDPVMRAGIQLVVDPMGKSMSGKWLGFDREFQVNSDAWELRWVEESSKSAQRDYHLKA